MNGSIKSYIIGFIVSILLTIAAYYVVVQHIYAGQFVIGTILALALAQLAVQLIFFLHLTKESNPHWNLIFFISTFSIVLIVVIGSIWIMNHLNSYMMVPDMQNTQKYLINQP